MTERTLAKRKKTGDREQSSALYPDSVVGQAEPDVLPGARAATVARSGSLEGAENSSVDAPSGHDFSLVQVHSNEQVEAAARAAGIRQHTQSHQHEQSTDEEEQASFSSGRKRAKPAQQQHGSKRRSGCNERVTRATGFRQYIDLVRSAEQRLIAAGFRDADSRIRMLSGIYYGTPWSLDYEVEHSDVRNYAFQAYTARVGAGPDPRACLGCGLFQSLKESQDVGGVDMGHVIIGLNARASTISREVPVLTQGATGLEITTWVGDLGGATARVALDRVSNPGAPVTRYFQGTDYGARSNLEGDVAAYVVAAGQGRSATVAPTTLPRSNMIADALEAHFLSGEGRPDRFWHFLIIQGGRFQGRTLANRGEVEQAMARKFASFGLWYMGNHLLQHNQLDLSRMQAASANLASAANDVAHHFVDWLLSRLPADIPAAPSPAAPGMLDRLREIIGF